NVGIWSWAPETGDFQCSPGMHALFCLDADDPLPTHGGYAELVADEDRAMVQNLLHTVWMNKRPSFTVRHRVRTGDSRLRWFEASGQLLAAPAEQTMLIGVVRDITEQHIQARKLAESQE